VSNFVQKEDGIRYGMNERWLLANAMVVVHKKANKRDSIAAD